jgi:hypothetical protein
MAPKQSLVVEPVEPVETHACLVSRSRSGRSPSGDDDANHWVFGILCQ